ncbi:hypothetical protein [Mycolicibacterium elephantis]|uniref:hypothetical protein n=1 Tax=Mycolicibacterium elephantis TaxID=81858 RepID=UPI0010422986|nr:hypothetical protein [Mycolicibacterium elephantis]
MADVKHGAHGAQLQVAAATRFSTTTDQTSSRRNTFGCNPVNQGWSGVAQHLADEICVLSLNGTAGGPAGDRETT